MVIRKRENRNQGVIVNGGAVDKAIGNQANNSADQVAKQQGNHHCLIKSVALLSVDFDHFCNLLHCQMGDHQN
jgi:hypothetical protein